jgi:hypothetical protein
LGDILNMSEIWYIDSSRLSPCWDYLSMYLWLVSKLDNIKRNVLNF